MSNPDTALFHFKYTGSLADNLSWDFGDGSSTASGDSVSHTYTTSGQYQVCLTAYNSCDTTMFCDTITVTLNPGGTSEIAQNKIKQFHFQLLPNPARHKVKVRFEIPQKYQTPATSIEVYSVSGRFITRQKLHQQKGAIKLNINDW